MVLYFIGRVAKYLYYFAAATGGLVFGVVAVVVIAMVALTVTFICCFK